MAWTWNFRRWFSRAPAHASAIASDAANDDAEPAPLASPAARTWHVVAESIRGAMHVRRDAPNQDAIRWERYEGEPPFIVLSVSDGHGSAKCFRSDRGAQLAVHVGLDETRSFLLQNAAEADLSVVKRMVEEQLPRRLAYAWREAVERDLVESPLLAAETARVGQAQGVTARESVERTPIVAYGATLLVVAVHPQFIASLQLGDGDILQVDAAGRVERLMEEDRRLFANETTSLSGDHAWRDFRCHFAPLVDHPPALLLVATDGYGNSFNTDADFLRVGSDLLQLMRDEGPDYIRANLGSWLQTASTQGSGDDITAGLLFCADALKPSEQEHSPPSAEAPAQQVAPNRAGD